jgi:hypothetical protein
LTGDLQWYTSAITQHGVRLALAEEDAADLARDEAVPIHDDMTPAMLISSGLDIEAQQYVFFVSHPTFALTITYSEYDLNLMPAG